MANDHTVGLKLTRKNSTFSHGEDEEKRKQHKNQVRYHGCWVGSLSHVFYLLLFLFLSSNRSSSSEFWSPLIEPGLLFIIENRWKDQEIRQSSSCTSYELHTRDRLSRNKNDLCRRIWFSVLHKIGRMHYMKDMADYTR
jgi:hypothetical protein